MLRAVLWALAAVAPQASPPAPRTVGERIAELEARIADLEKRERAAREARARKAAAAWVRRYREPVGLAADEAAKIEALWVSWFLEERDRPSDPDAWRRREAALRSCLSEGQAASLAREVVREEKALATITVAEIASSARIPSEKIEPLAQVALRELTFAEGALIPHADPARRVTWQGVLRAVEACLSKTGTLLTADEVSGLQKAVRSRNP